MDPDQLASAGASCSGSKLFQIEVMHTVFKRVYIGFKHS